MNTVNESADIIVIGSGLAGLAAAIEATQAGRSVTVLEKMKITGGNTRISDGALAAPGNYLQKKMGIADSPELFFKDMMAAGLGMNHPELVRVVAENAADTIDWTRSVLGVRYLDQLDRFGGHSAARSLTTRGHSGKDIIKAQVAALERLGITVHTRCRFNGFVTDDAGNVCGVNVRDGYRYPDAASGTAKTLLARRAVILATGGFGNDKGFRRLQQPALDETVQSTNHRGATAEGLVAALGLKAAPIHLSWIQLGPWGCSDEKGYGKGGRFASYAVFPAGIMVDPATGRRIVNEWADRRQRSEAMMSAGHPCIGIVDAKGAEKDAESLKYCLPSGKVKGFDDIQDLAVAWEIPIAALKDTVNRYNEIIAAGNRDEFGKDLSRDAYPVATPPFYTIRLYPKVHYTPGGVAINTEAQVLDLAGRPIPRLYAAGEVTGGVHGASRLGSNALTECLVFGRIAGQSAAAMTPQFETP
jgi:flavocytochrome c